MIASLLGETVARVARLVCAPGIGYLEIAPALALAGLAGAGLFAPIQAALLGAVQPHEQGQA